MLPFNSWLTILSLSIAITASATVWWLACRLRAGTARKNAEALLARQEALLATTSRMGEIGGWELERDTCAVFWSDMVYRIHDLPVGQLPSFEQALAFYPPAARDVMHGAVATAFEQGKAFDVVTPFITARGRQRWVRDGWAAPSISPVAASRS